MDQVKEVAAENEGSECIQCSWCGEYSHHIGQHLLKGRCNNIPAELVGLEPAELFKKYKAMHPDAPTMSQLAAAKIREAYKKADGKVPAKDEVVSYAIAEFKTELVPAHGVFGLKLSALSRSNGEPLMVNVNVNTPFPELVPEIREDYVFGDIELLKDVLMMLETGIPGYIFGHAGTGKSTIISQVCARLNRPMIRAQHTASTEESQIVGQILAKNGSTYFEPGLLSLAMRLGWVYLADEYDFAYPQILGIYQPVLEGEALTLKEATPEWRTVKPHAKFAFIGTGNTNGSGDETGLYQGTNIQNAANFSRFGIVAESQYMKAAQEIDMLVNIGVDFDSAKNLVKFATEVRSAYISGKVSQPIGPRELRLAAIVGLARGNLSLGINKAYANKMPSVSAQVVREIAQRIFGV